MAYAEQTVAVVETVQSAAEPGAVEAVPLRSAGPAVTGCAVPGAEC